MLEKYGNKPSLPAERQQKQHTVHRLNAAKLFLGQPLV